MVGSFTSTVGRRFGLTDVNVIHQRGEPDESRHALECQYQGEAGYFDVDAPIYEGDFVELDDPRSDRKMQHYVSSVTINHSPFPSSPSFIKATWGKASTVRATSVTHNTTTITVTGNNNTLAVGSESIAVAHRIAVEGPPEYQQLSATIAHILESLRDLQVHDDDRAAVLDAAETLLDSLDAVTPDPPLVRRRLVAMKNALAGLAQSATVGANVAVAAFANEQVAAFLRYLQQHL